MKRITWLFAAVVALALLPTSASASVISLLGDKDCFGLGGACPDGTRWQDDLGGVFFTSNQGIGDPAFTDVWSTPDDVSYTHTYAMGGAPISAELEVKIAGIHDINTGQVYDVLFNGVSVGVIPPNLGGDAFQEVLTYLFAVPTGLLTGSDVVSWSGTGGDGYSIDYSELRVATAVPEPATLFMMGAGLAMLVRRRQSARLS